MTLIEYLLDEEDGMHLGVLGLSLVFNPAHKEEAVAMSDTDNIWLTPTDEADRIVKGVFVKAGKAVKQRYGGGQESFISADTIKKMRDRFHKSGADKNISLHHEKNKDGEYVYQDDCYVAESYIVNNEHDIASLAAQGISNAALGDWVVGVKVSEDVWENDVLTGDVKGLSMEGTLRQRPVEMSEYQKQLKEIETLAEELFNKM